MMANSATGLLECYAKTQENLHYNKNPRSKDDLEKTGRNLARFAKILILQRDQIRLYAERIKLLSAAPSELREAKGLLVDMHLALESIADLMTIESDKDGESTVSLRADSSTMERAASDFINPSRRLKLVLPD